MLMCVNTTQFSKIAITIYKRSCSCNKTHDNNVVKFEEEKKLAADNAAAILRTVKRRIRREWYKGSKKQWVLDHFRREQDSLKLGATNPLHVFGNPFHLV